MTNAQKWIAAFLGLFIILFLLGRITNKEVEKSAPTMGQMTQQSGTTSSDVDGLTLIKQTGCISCHGSDLNGTSMAPALANLKEHWTRDALLNYLRNPSSYSGDARFDDYRSKYKNVVMPSYGNIDVKALGRMAEYLLTK